MLEREAAPTVVVLIEADGMARQKTVRHDAAMGAEYLVDPVRIYPKKDDPYYHMQKRVYRHGKGTGPYFWFHHIEAP
jgi:hypothetical protein